MPETAKILDDKSQASFGGNLTEEESLELIKSLLKLPHLFIVPKIPERTDEQLKPFVKELYLYCQKKQINLRSYIFDEFGLVIAASALGVGYYNDYKVYYKGDAAKESKKHTDDYQHAIEVDKLNKESKVTPNVK